MCIRDSAYNVFMNSLDGVSIATLRKGLQSVGVKDNEVIVFSDLMDSKSLFLTANADTVYAIGILDLTKGPMVLELSLIHISEPTRLLSISYAVFCL